MATIATGGLAPLFAGSSDVIYLHGLVFDGGGFVHKAGVAAFQLMLDSLAEGHSIALSADVPKVARVAGLGIIKLAQASGRPIYPSAIATSRRIVLNNWDRTTVNLPFGRGAGVAADEECRSDPPQGYRHGLPLTAQSTEPSAAATGCRSPSW